LVRKKRNVFYLLESVNDLGDGVEVTDVPAGMKQAKNTRQNRFTIIVIRLVHNDVCHPRTYLQVITIIIVIIIAGEVR